MYMYVDRYTVETGDTLFTIAKKFELISYTQILRVNPDIKDPDLIYIGQVINIPKALTMCAYMVRSGDTLWRIICDYNRHHIGVCGQPITLDEVLAFNPRIKNPNCIYPGQIIYLPMILCTYHF